ncbi:Proline porter II [Thiorhodovibrio winogradskyi]|uniref:Proline porter II n=1 Tax=Thiorhodovibrio winogradskyi TaxID=77007 RepID=A0ABZ0S6J9_9GAMM|nr:MFS transporter [Thiorhodovibrio winogradskyi]
MNRRLYLAGLVGEIMEWYDFTVYGFFAVVIASQFFPSEDPFVSMLSALAAFAVGFLMRPIGALVFGPMGDLFGRRRVLTTAVFLMAFPSLIIGLLPTYASIGVLAPTMLVLMRMLQGMSVGGEHTGCVVYLSEQGSSRHRALTAAVPFIGTVLGVLLGSLVGVSIYALFDAATVAAWAWRIPFLLGVLIALVGLMVRRHLPESFRAADDAARPSLFSQLLNNHWRAFLQVFFLNIVFASGFYTVFIYNPMWLQHFVGESKDLTLQINSLALAMAILGIVISALLADRVGRKPLLYVSTIGITLMSYPIYALMLHEFPLYVLLGQLSFGLLIGLFMGVVGSVMVELFSAEVRSSAVSISFNLCFALFGGTAPMLATWLVHTTGNPLNVAWVLSAGALASLITVVTLPETRGRDTRLLDARGGTPG